MDTIDLHRDDAGRHVGEMRDPWGFVTRYVVTVVERDGRRALMLERALVGVPEAYRVPGDAAEAA